MKVVIAYIEEPPFGWTDADQSAMGADIELADSVLRAIGVTHVEHRLTTFAELLPGVRNGRWDMNVPLFVTPERMAEVEFSVPVWAIGDGFLVRSGNPKALTSYESVAQRADARLGVIVGQVQHVSAQAKGVRNEQILLFEQQAHAIAAVESGEIDAYASTALGKPDCRGARWSYAGGSGRARVERQYRYTGAGRRVFVQTGQSRVGRCGERATARLSRFCRASAKHGAIRFNRTRDRSRVAIVAARCRLHEQAALEEACERMQKTGARTATIDADHFAPLTATELTVDTLIRLA